ncbi:hypothetical protein VKS41_007699 [Umbelopsis sp. WA50703]
MASQEKLQSQLKEISVIQSELSSLRPSAAVYQKKVNGSNILFRATDRKAVSNSYQVQKETLLKQLNNTASKQDQ